MIRAATQTDYATFAALARALGEPIPARERWLANQTLISMHGGRADGYVRFCALAGHVDSIAVAADARGRGIGGELVDAAASALRERGAHEWRASVTPENAPAIRLCERLGRIEHRSTVVRIAWTAPLPAERAIALPVGPDEDDDVERALGLLAGRVAMGRRGDRVLVQLRDEQCAAVGYAALDARTGVAQFHVVRPVLAGTLLAALARPGMDHAQLVIEDDPALVAVLLAAGGESGRELVHYRGGLGAAGGSGASGGSGRSSGSGTRITSPGS